MAELELTWIATIMLSIHSTTVSFNALTGIDYSWFLNLFLTNALHHNFNVSWSAIKQVFYTFQVHNSYCTSLQKCTLMIQLWKLNRNCFTRMWYVFVIWSNLQKVPLLHIWYTDKQMAAKLCKVDTLSWLSYFVFSILNVLLECFQETDSRTWMSVGEYCTYWIRNPVQSW